MKTMKISDVRVGERLRQDMGDIVGLAASIADLGLLHPVIVDHQGLLLAGARRLAACKRLGWTDIPVTIVSATTAVEAKPARA